MLANAVMGLDCSFKKTGVAVWERGNLFDHFGAVFPVKKGENPAKRFAEFTDFLQQQIELFNPGLICVERPHMQGFAATACGMGLYTRVQELAYRNGIPCQDIRADHLKIFATGKGNATKELMKIAASELFPNYYPDTDEGGDIADAIHIMRWGVEGCPSMLRPKKPQSSQDAPESPAKPRRLPVSRRPRRR